MFLTQELSDAISAVLSNACGSSARLEIIRAVSGGSINRCFEITSGAEKYFLKLNDAERFPAMFLAEATGLKTLENAGAFVPDVIGTGTAGNEQFLILSWIEKGRGSVNSQQELGRMLANVHRNTSAFFGLHYDNFLGSLLQLNKKSEDGVLFFINERLKVQVDLAVSNQLINTDIRKKFDRLFKCLSSLIPAEGARLIHGDLWSGNYLLTHKGKPYRIDPAIAYAHREADIAMTALFGGFEPDFYTAYNEFLPLEPGWKERTGLWNLYPLLVHLNLFGRGYLPDIVRNLKAFL